MNKTKEFLKRYSLVIGILLMFLLTWPIDLANSGVLFFKVPFALALLVGWGFVIASLIMTALTLGRDGVVALLKRFLIWRVGWKWYLVTFLLYPAILILAVLLNAAFTHTPLDFSNVFAHQIFGPAANLPLFILPLFIFNAIINGEEIGWRGYVLPRLQAKYSALVSSLFVGVIWALWHIPKFMAPGNSSPFIWFMVKIIADSVIYAWLYNNTRGSLLLLTLFHSSSNTAGAFLPIANTASGSNQSSLIIEVVLIILVAVVVTVTQGPARLSRSEPKQVQM